MALSILKQPRKHLAPAKPKVRRRKSTIERITEAATAEFCDHGYSGARVNRIVQAAKSNPRLLYHHFGSKGGLYIAVLEQMYGELRTRERALNLGEVEPLEGMRQLMEFTFDHFGNHPGLIRLMNNENLMRARFLRRSPRIRAMATPLVAAIDDLLRRGQRKGIFRRDVDSIQLYVSITALSYFHVSNRYTLSALFDVDVAGSSWIKRRRVHAREMLLGYLQLGSATRLTKGVVLEFDGVKMRRNGQRALKSVP